MAHERWRKMVERACDKEPEYIGNVGLAFAAKLLARQHAEVVEMVKKLKRGKGHTPLAICQPAYQLACNDILAALAKQGRKQ